MNQIIELSDLKVGDEIPIDAVIREVWVPLYYSDGRCERLRLENVPVMVFCA
jgi:hypothetical protein